MQPTTKPTTQPGSSVTSAAVKALNPTIGTPEAVATTPTQVASNSLNLGGNPVDIYNQALDQLGIADARTRVKNLNTQMANTQGLLSKLEGDVSARTANTVVTENQRRRLVATEAEPINEQLSTITKAAELANADYGRIMNEGTNVANLAIKGQEMEESTRQFNTQQKEAKRQFDAQQKAAQKERKLSKIQIKAQKDQFNKSQAEEKRQFNESLAEQRRQANMVNARASSGGGTSVSERNYSDKQAKNEAVNTVDRLFVKGKKGVSSKAILGQDGYADPKYYNQLLKEWVKAGFTAKDFNSQYAEYRNPNDKSYNVPKKK